MRPSRVLSALVLTGLLSGCAAITTGTSQSVAVQTTPENGAECELVNEKGTWVVRETPGSATVNKAYGPLVVSCRHPGGAKGATSVTSSTAGATFGNILMGGIIGAAVDMGSGAAYTYPETVTVALAAAPGAPGTTPAAPRQTMDKGTAMERLKTLSELRSQGLIAEEEYNRQLRTLLDSM